MSTPENNISSIPVVLNNWTEHNSAISAKLDDLACVLYALETAMNGPKPADPSEEKGTAPEPGPNFTHLLHKSASLRSRFDGILKKLHEITD